MYPRLTEKSGDYMAGKTRRYSTSGPHEKQTLQSIPVMRRTVTALPSPETGVRKGTGTIARFTNPYVRNDHPADSLVYVPHVGDNAGTGGSGKKKVRK